MSFLYDEDWEPAPVGSVSLDGELVNDLRWVLRAIEEMAQRGDEWAVHELIMFLGPTSLTPERVAEMVGGYSVRLLEALEAVTP